MTNFEGTVVQKHREDLIEAGTSFAVDNSFKSFAKTHPNYLIDGIVTRPKDKEAEVHEGDTSVDVDDAKPV